MEGHHFPDKVIYQQLVACETVYEKAVAIMTSDYKFISIHQYQAVLKNKKCRRKAISIRINSFKTENDKGKYITLHYRLYTHSEQI